MLLLIIELNRIFLSIYNTIRSGLSKFISLISSSSILLNFGIFRNTMYYNLIIKNNYWFTLLLYICLLTLLNTTTIIFTENYDNYQDFLNKTGLEDVDKKRTCYEVMNEPYPFERPMAIGHPNGDWTYFESDGTERYFIAYKESNTSFERQREDFCGPFEARKRLFESIPTNSDSSSVSNSNSDCDYDSSSVSGSISNSSSDCEELEQKTDSNSTLRERLLARHKHLRNPDIILSELFEKVMTSETNAQGIRMSLDYVKDLIPENYWARTTTEVTENSTPINRYLDEFSSSCNRETPTEKAAFLQFHAACTTLNVVYLYPQATPDDVEKLFYYNVELVRKKYKVEF